MVQPGTIAKLVGGARGERFSPWHRAKSGFSACATRRKTAFQDAPAPPAARGAHPLPAPPPGEAPYERGRRCRACAVARRDATAPQHTLHIALLGRRGSALL